MVTYTFGCICVCVVISSRAHGNSLRSDKVDIGMMICGRSEIMHMHVMYRETVSAVSEFVYHDVFLLRLLCCLKG